ncbi:hypothetical protein JTE90_006827 [Oedothorax gibbosus]|uniref:Integrase catalytic domain-containing protein n=1 Tax=Oedothorax gibbosus TaxID=931172 RepID=A0AAV6U6H1_9ARAC|nr:hypothetical protein JTE90_006827 [Oedothorax gibbosus]
MNRRKKNSPPEGEKPLQPPLYKTGKGITSLFIDSGATSHMCFNPDLFFEFTTQTDSYITLQMTNQPKLLEKDVAFRSLRTDEDSITRRIAICCDISRYTGIFFLKNKDEAKDAFLKYKACIENRTGKKIKVLRIVNGLEYVGKAFDQFLTEEGIRREKTVPYCPQQNGVAECKNRIYCSTARCLLSQANLDPSFWAEAVRTSAQIRNRCLTKGVAENKTPYEIFFDRKPTACYFKIFLQKAFVLNKPKRSKFEPRLHEVIFIGYSDQVKAFRFFDPNTRKIIVSRDAKFIDEINTSFEDDQQDQQWYDFPIEYPADPATDTHGETNPETETSPTDHQPMRDEQQPILRDDVTTEEEDDSEGEADAPLRRDAGRPRKEKTSRSPVTRS